MESSEQPKETTQPNTPDAPEKNPDATEAQPEHAEDSKTESRFGASERKVKDAVSGFFRKHIKGERLPEEDQAGMSKADVAQAIGGGMVGAAASMGGIKSFADVPRWFTQKYFTGQEKSRIQEALSSQESSPEPSSVDQKKQTIEKAVTDSKYLSPDKKKELIQQLQETIEKYETELAQSELTKNEAIAKLLDEAINTRVKGSTAIKETMNTALMATGLATLRGLGYGAVALYERGVKVSAEMEKGERGDSFAKELIVNGFKETFNAITFSEGKTKREKVVNAAKAIGTVMRFAGFTRLAEMEISNEGVSSAIDKALDLFEQKGVVGAASENIEHNLDKVTFGAFQGEAAPAAEVPATDHAPSAPIEKPANPTSTELPKTESAQFVSATANVESPAPQVEIAEATIEPEVSKDDLDLATIRKGDGFIKIAERQLGAHPEKFGFTGDTSDTKAVAKWAKKMANNVAKQSHLMNSGLTGKGIGKVAITLENHDGKLAFHFVDAKTGGEIDSDKTLVYERKIAPKIPLETKITPPDQENVQQDATPDTVVETASDVPAGEAPVITPSIPETAPPIPTAEAPTITPPAPETEVTDTTEATPPVSTEQEPPPEQQAAAPEAAPRAADIHEKGKYWEDSKDGTKSIATPETRILFKTLANGKIRISEVGMMTDTDKVQKLLVEDFGMTKQEFDQLSTDGEKFRVGTEFPKEEYAAKVSVLHLMESHGRQGTPEYKALFKDIEADKYAFEHALANMRGAAWLKEQLAQTNDHQPPAPTVIEQQPPAVKVEAAIEHPPAVAPTEHTPAPPVHPENATPVEHLEQKTDLGEVKFDHGEKGSTMEIKGDGWNMKYSSTITNEGGEKKIHTKINFEGGMQSTFDRILGFPKSIIEKGGNLELQRNRANFSLDNLDRDLKLAHAFKAIGKQESEDGKYVFQALKRHLEQFREKYPDVKLPEEEIKKVIGS